MDVDEIDAKSLNEIGVSTRVWRGWRVSYRTKEPEKETAEQCAARIAHKQKLSIDQPFSTEVGRTKTAAERKAASDKSSGVRKARGLNHKTCGLDLW